MELGQIVLIVIFCLVLLLFVLMTIASKASPWSRKKKTVGSLRVYTDDPDGPYLFLELRVPVSEVMGKKQVTLDVDVRDYISQN